MKTFVITMGEGAIEESIMKETNFLAGLFQQIVADCKVLTNVVYNVFYACRPSVKQCDGKDASLKLTPNTFSTKQINYCL